MSEDDGVIVVDVDAAQGHDVVAQGLLELWRHKVVARTTPVQDRKVDLEPEEVEEERDGDEPKGAGCKMLCELLERQAALVVEEVP